MSNNPNKLASKHTRGPWFYQEDSDVYTHIVRPTDFPGRIICHLGQEYEANARLISAAPEAIEFIADWLEYTGNSDFSDDGAIAMINRAEAILKKAYNL